ncbi:MAG: hypothetical protein E6R03_13615 [Hyphomicrobiaceae bacterium]|nr:MAG: hypothetical protein E6R03_13615 [Hyphomicrobiaceae bacterium]
MDDLDDLLATPLQLNQSFRLQCESPGQLYCHIAGTVELRDLVDPQCSGHHRHRREMCHCHLDREGSLDFVLGLGCFNHGQQGVDSGRIDFARVISARSHELVELRGGEGRATRAESVDEPRQPAFMIGVTAAL